VGLPGRARTVAWTEVAVNGPHPGLSSTPKGSSASGSHSAILALIQLFELWKSLTAFPGPTSSSGSPTRINSAGGSDHVCSRSPAWRGSLGIGLVRSGPPPEGRARFLMSGSDQGRGDMSETGGPLPFLRRVAVSEPVCEQVVDTHVAIVDVLRNPIGKIPAPVDRGGLIVRCTAEVDLDPRHLSESKLCGLDRSGKLDVSGFLGDACRRRPSGRCLLGVGLLLASAPQATRRPFFGFGGLGLILRFLEG
jgi:hypothetical protein